MRNITKIILFTASIALLSVSCSKYLDKEFDATLNEQKVFTDERLTRQFLNNVYTRLYNGIYMAANSAWGVNGFHDCITDDGITNGMHSSAVTFTNGALSETNNPQEFWWSYFYAGIRSANVFLKYVDMSPTSNATAAGDDNKLLDRYKAEARLLRAEYHFELMKRWGNIPIVTQVFEITDNLNVERDSTSKVIDFIASECDSAYLKLPFKYTSDVNQGRVCGSMALALKSRVLLYAASPLFNPSGDVTKWKRAADAAAEFIAANKANGTTYKLNTSYEKVFTDLFNDEVVFACQLWNTSDLETNNAPTGFKGAWGMSNPSQELVDEYETTSGKMITDATSGYDATIPYANRDPRFGYTIFYNGAEWLNRKIETFDGGTDRVNSITTVTGYYVRKWMNKGINFQETLSEWHSWVMFRYAEILLNYAEARNEAYGPDQEVYDAIDAIRQRTDVSMPKLPEGLTQEDMRDRIRHERRVELAFEDHRYYDVRRWKLGETLFNRPVTGVRIAKDESNNLSYSYYSVESSLGRVFKARDYFFPIPYSQRTNAPKLGQNPGW